jgi:hypothetical protein
MKELVGDQTTSEQGRKLREGLEISRYNASVKMIGLIAKMQINGLWLMYK